ncbi:GT4 family glycosyltransferase PelF [Venenivibrio stagnispumantis]|uniref:Glycosyltransferase involved in cell wall bisynthesis n=1 Tax=Venenivibrio stagnispumantis TaxID=407998 RepID=A0AA45WIA5_9AQUI|nr:GT4 family glycosyltransferase PelF [Venenivibrio stagnispumantis]MCW4572764.1 GT4 family glycosyltransferase PelF [Venenivibrio stagnispumantis]SMP00310.1 Glycosyltransferase involved in cell wall bisynthesis [Venenivibrio stagnispumantis]
MSYIRKADNVDILILAEGTYPYIKGGVSSWIHQLISGLKDFTFGVVFLGSRKEDYGEIGYKLPDNLLHLEVHYLFDNFDKPVIRKLKGNKKSFKKVEELHNFFKEKKELPKYLKNLDFYNKEVDFPQFLYSKLSFERIVNEYMKHCPDLPFIDYFWTVRNIHYPIWKITKIAENLNIAKIYHSPSTGYAGFLGSLLKFSFKKPFILTEHGIYTRERKIDLLTAEWVKEHKPYLLKGSIEENYIKNMWVKFFEGINYFCYEGADKILSLFEGARQIQISYGAKAEKTEVIPNGVDIERYIKLVPEKEKYKNLKTISLIGRVVPIKDIKTFIRAIRIVVDKIPDVQGWIVGPEDEDKEYAQECRDMVKMLSLEDNVKFLGFQKIDEILPKTKILTLTSISEGMPLVILEAFATGTPVVATDVGSCKDLIYGSLDEEDKEIGQAGFVTSIANPTELADKYIKLLTDENLWKACQKAALERVKKYYSQELFFQNYRRVYDEALRWQE